VAAIGVDVGGTKIAAGLVDETGRVLARQVLDTPSLSPADILDTVTELVDRLAAGVQVSAVGVGAAGFVDAEGSRVLFAPNLAWRDEPLRAELASRVDFPVTVENDANAAAWAEYRFGAARGEDQVAAVTVGTGIGGGLVIDGRLYRGRFGLAAEFGHQQLVPDGLPCGCGNRGCLEVYASGRALARVARERCGAQAWRSGPELTAAARAGDAVARACLAEIGGWLGMGLANLAAALDPGLFVIGGGVSQAGELLVGPARETFLALSGRGHRSATPIRLAELGTEAGLIGAADLARMAAVRCAS
jgi:glucokinase